MKTLFLLFFTSMAANAAVDKGVMDKMVTQGFVSKGRVTGGEAGSGFSVLDLRRTDEPKKKLERVVIDLGDFKGHPIFGKSGYYHAEVQEKPPRVILDLSQTSYTKVDEKQLRERFKSSLFVSSTDMTLNPEDHSLNITLNFKQKTGVKVFSVTSPKKTARLVLDFSAPQKAQ